MEFNKFCVSTMKIKSNWLDNNESYLAIGKEDGLNLYIQLFRYRIHQGDCNKHIFRLSLDDIKKFTKINTTRRLTLPQLKSLFNLLESNGIIKIHTNNINDMVGHEMMLVQAIDTPNIKRVNGIDLPVSIPEDYYVTISLSMIDYMYNELKLDSTDILIHTFFKKLSQGNAKEPKARVMINTIKDKFGFSDRKTTNILMKLNKGGIIATYIRRRKGGGVKFEHVVCSSVSKIRQFRIDNGKAMDIYIKRIENAEIKRLERIKVKNSKLLAKDIKVVN